MDSIAWVLHLHATDSSDSHLVWHLLTFCIQALEGLCLGLSMWFCWIWQNKHFKILRYKTMPLPLHPSFPATAYTVSHLHIVIPPHTASASTHCFCLRTMPLLHVVISPHPAPASTPCLVSMLYYCIDFISYLMGYLSAICLFSFIVISLLSDHKRFVLRESTSPPGI